MASELEPIAPSALQHCAVVSLRHTAFSAPLMHRLADNGIALVMLDANDRFKARLEGAVSGNVLLRRGGVSIPLVGTPAAQPDFVAAAPPRRGTA